MIQEVPVEPAPLVCTKPLCLANKPEGTKDDNMKLCFNVVIVKNLYECLFGRACVYGIRGIRSE